MSRKTGKTAKISHPPPQPQSDAAGIDSSRAHQGGGRHSSTAALDADRALSSESLSSPDTRSRSPLQWIVRGVLLAIGAALIWGVCRNPFAAPFGRTNPLSVIPISALVTAVLACLAGCLRIVYRPLTRLLERMRRPQPRVMAATAWGVALAAAIYFYATAIAQGRDFQPLWHDEFSTLLQARMFSQGHLYMPAHPLAAFFDTFHVLVTPAYASIYFPGAAMLYTPGIWFGWAPWMTPLLVTAGAVGLLYRVIGELLDGVYGLLAALLLMANPQVRLLSVMSMSQVPLLFAGLLVLWAWLNWRKRKGIGWALAVGFLGGWAISIRPPDALYFVLPVGVAMLWELRQQTPRKVLSTIAAGVLMVLPFGILQLAINHGVTGKWLTTPYSVELARDYPQLNLGFHSLVQKAVVVPALPQKQEFNVQAVWPWVLLHNEQGLAGSLEDRLPRLLQTDCACALLILLIPLGLLGLRDVRLWAVAVAVPLYVALYALYPLYNGQYAVMAAPAVILLILLGGSVAAGSLRRPAGLASVAVVLLIGALAVRSMLIAIVPGWGPPDQKFASADLRMIDYAIEKTIGDKKAIVLFHFDAACPPDVEPVYNWHDSRPDDARIIRAHDRGKDNKRLYDYYLRPFPDRGVYLLDRRALLDSKIPLTPRYLGTVKELADKP